MEFPADMFLSPPGNAVEVHPETVEYAKKLLDELSASKPPAKQNKPVPPVPRFNPQPLNRKMSKRDLWGDSETDNISETDWEKKKVDSSDGEMSAVENLQGDDISTPEDDSSTDTEGEDVESSGSNYESTSSFERRKEKQKKKQELRSSTRKTVGSATCKQAAAGRKKSHQMSESRKFLSSPQSVYMKEKVGTRNLNPAPQKKTATQSSDSEESSSKEDDRKPAAPKRRKVVVSSPSDASSSELEMDAPQKAPSRKKVPPPKKAGKASIAEVGEPNAGKKPAKGTKLPAKVIDMQFQGDMRAGVGIVDSRPGKKRTRAGRKRKDDRRGRKNGSRNVDDDGIPEQLPPKEAQVRPTVEQLNSVRITAELPGVVEDPMLPEEIINPLIVNELADDGIILADELTEEIKIWDAKVSCIGGYNWILGDINSHTFADPPYPALFVPEGPPGPNIPGLETMHAVEVLERFLPLKFWTQFAQETNAYRARCAENPKNADPDETEVETGLRDQPNAKLAWQNDYDLNWVPISLGQSLRWFGIHIGMAIRPRHNTASYWDSNDYGCLRHDDYSSYMSRNRFNLITKYMYINHAQEHHFDAKGKLLDPYHKVRPLIDLCVHKWAENWFIGEFNSIDEGKVQYSGTMCPVRSYDPDKPIKHGIKFICANDSLTGYCWGIEPYTGAGHRVTGDSDEDFKELNIGERLVLYFASKSPAYTQFFTDRWYTTPRLCELMYERHQCFLTGTMMANKKGVPWRHLCGFNQLDSDRGFYTWAWEKNKNLWAIMWKDRSVVPVISNRYGVEPELIERGGGGKYKTAKLKPTNVPYGRYMFTTSKMVKPYNRYMGGTDMWDKLRMALFYSIEAVTHCHKWWQKCWWGLVDGALVNAFICWRSVDPKRRTHMKFMLSIHQALVNNQFDTTGTWGPNALKDPVLKPRARKDQTPKSPNKPIVMMPKITSPTQVKHELVVLTKTKFWQNKLRRREIKSNKRANKRCVYCRQEGRKDSFTKWVCAGCGFVPLCNIKTKRSIKQDCFRKYHEQLRIEVLIGQREVKRATELL